MAKFKVGDRVRAVKETSLLNYVDVYVVERVDGNDVFVDVGDGYGVLGYSEDYFKPLPVAAEAQPAADAPANKLKLREGVAYKAANGAKVGPLIDCGGYWNCENRTGVEGNPGHYTGFGISAFKGILPRPEWRSKFDLVAEWADEPAVTPVETEPDTTLHIKFTSDFSELDAAIAVRKKKFKKLIKLARKAGIELREAA
ncbi:hypothetical protein [Shinella sp. BYT-45]|uniref:hypothetical protein n=1 Tax=Shinella sp. BYT-45 TaxID=3377377 RepID=UPI00398046F7